MTRSPHDFVIPRNGRWYIVGHTWGLRNSSRISVTPLQVPQPMDPARHQHVDLASIARDAAEFGASEAPDIVDEPVRDHDVFISHASEDKDDIARPLAESLRTAGLDTWYDEFELKIGMSLRRSIDRGLAKSRFGVVILSPSFFEKGWSNYELDGLVTREVQGDRQMILPIWHRVTKSEVTNYSPSLADKLALSTADSTPDEIADEIASVVRS